MSPLAAAGGDIRDIRGPISVPPTHPWWPYALAAACVIALALAVVYAIRRRRRAVPSDVRALLALDAARELIDRADPMGFSTSVSAAVRSYVEDAFSVHAPKLTTEELLGTLMTDAGPVASHRAELGTFLEFCDLAKYARWSLSRNDMTGMLDSATAFVRATAGGSP
jgi:Domain of unknown function (DUF4381)